MPVRTASANAYHAIERSGKVGGYGPDLSGNRYGRLVAVRRSGTSKQGHAVWECVCDCGNITDVQATRLKTGTTKSCGCLNTEVRRDRWLTHGMTETAIHALWCKVMERCYSESDPAYDRYGGRGIKVCDRWHDFKNFYEDMGDRPEGRTLDRINNDGDYSPDNCRWATYKRQNRNKRNTIIVEFNGETACLKDLTEKYGLNYQTVYARIKKHGWSVDDALTIKPKKGGNHGRVVEPGRRPCRVTGNVVNIVKLGREVNE